jgi:hypothetical protein
VLIVHLFVGHTTRVFELCGRLFRRNLTEADLLTFLLWCLLLVICWPLALLALILYPIVWLILLPFRLVGIAVGGVFDLLKAILYLPARLLRPRRV